MMPIQKIYDSAAFPAIQALINQGALFVCNDSAGKDSQAMRIALEAIVPASQMVVVHANLPEVEWPGNLEHIRKYSKNPVFEVQAVKTFFEMVESRQKFPSPSTRQCTSDLKRGPIQKFINNYAKTNGFSIVVNCMGLRAQESSARAKKLSFQYMPGKSAKHRAQYEWLPIHDWLIGDVWSSITAAGQKRHYAYELGMSRLSCCFCIMSNDSDLRIAADAQPELAARYIEVETRLNFTLSMSRVPLKNMLSTKLQNV